MAIDSKKIVENIQFLAKNKGIKIGELEKKAGVTVGYLSRFLNSESSVPKLDVIYTIANELGVNIDSLLSDEYISLNETDLYMVSTIYSLVKKTKERKIIWNRQTFNYITSLRISNTSIGYIVDHPLSVARKANGVMKVMLWSYYKSKAIEVFNDIFVCQKGDNTFYLVSYFDSEEFDTNYELYCYNTHNKRRVEDCIIKICNASGQISKESIYVSLKALYEACEAASRTPIIDDNVKEAINILLDEDK